MSAGDRWCLDTAIEAAGSVVLISRRDEARLTIELLGDIDAANAAILGDHLHRMIAVGGVRELVMDLARVEFLDVAGLRLLLAAQSWAADHQAACRFVHLSPAVGYLVCLIGRDSLPPGTVWGDAAASPEPAAQPRAACAEQGLWASLAAGPKG